MPVLAGALVDEARDYHPAFDRRQVPDRMVLRELSRHQRRLAAKVVLVSEDALAVPVSFSKALVDAAALDGVSGAGLALPEYLLVLSAYTRYTAGGSDIPVELVTYANNQAQAIRDFPSAYLIRQTLYPVNRGRAGLAMKGDTTAPHGWEELDGMTLLVVPNPPELITLESEVTLPSVAHDALVVNLARWMGARGSIRMDLGNQAREAEDAAIAALGSQDTTSTWTVVRKR
jgi:hypothetical protein